MQFCLGSLGARASFMQHLPVCPSIQLKVNNYLWALYVTVREEPYRPSRRGRVRKTLFGVKKCSTMHNSEDKIDRRIRREETKTCWSHLLSSTSLYSERAFKEGSVYTFHHRMSRLCLSGDAVEL